MREWLIRFRYKCYAFLGICWGLLALMSNMTTAFYFALAVIFLALCFFGDDLKA